MEIIKNSGASGKAPTESHLARLRSFLGWQRDPFGYHQVHPEEEEEEEVAG
jgi:hypothetical protein